MKDVNVYYYLRGQMKRIFQTWGLDIQDLDVNRFYDSLKEVIDNSNSFKLYRYMPAKYYNIRNFENEIIHLTPNGLFNDIYEGLPANQANCLTNRAVSLLGESTYISCFSETPYNVLMWSHYAQSHTGFCVEYELKELGNEEILKHIFPVLYNNKRFENYVDINDLVENLENLNYNMVRNGDNQDVFLCQLLPLFIIKGKMWESECEWRIIYTRQELYEKGDTNYIDPRLQNIDFSCISAIYLGFRIDDEVKKNIIEIVKRKNDARKQKIKIFQARLSENDYELQFCELNK